MHTIIALIKQRTVKIPYNPLALNHEYVNDAKSLKEKIIDLIQENNKVTKVIMTEKTGVSKTLLNHHLKFLMLALKKVGTEK